MKSLRSHRMRVLHRASICALSWLVAASAANALDSRLLITQHGHTAWRFADGDLPAPVYPITQTADGYLWIGTQAGVVRYDGARFVPLTALTRTPLPDPFVVSLVAARDGSLWIGTSKGLSHWTNQQLTNYPDQSHGVAAMLEDRSGALWLASRLPDDEVTLCRVAGAALRCYGKADGIDLPGSGRYVGTLTQDRAGNFWVSMVDSVLRWKPGSRSVAFRADAKARAADGSVMFLAADPSGPLWLGIDARGAGLGLQQIVDGVLKAPLIPQIAPGSLAVQALFVDRTNTLWIGTLDQGIYRLHGDRIDHFDYSDGLSGDSVYWFYEDREGNLWVSTSGGIDRFRDLRVATFSRREGLSVAETDTLLATRDGRIWIGSAEALDILDHGHVVSLKAGHGLPGHQVTSLMQDAAGQIWVGIDNTLNLYSGGRFVPVNGLDGKPLGFVLALAEDGAGNIWVNLRDKLVRIRDGRAREELIPGLGITHLAASPTAGLWLQLPNGDLARYRLGRFERFSYNLKDNTRRSIIATPDGAVLGATDAGVVGWKDGRQRTLTATSGLPCNSINALTVDNRGALWLYAQCGLIEVPPDQVREWWQSGGLQVHARLLDFFDGVRPGRAPFVGAVTAPDGRVWLANGTVVQMLDPLELPGPHTPPPVHIELVVADRKGYAANAEVRLPPNPRDLEIDYTAASLAVPQRVRFRYKLEGHDLSWQEPGNRRQAFYNDLAPGTYTFRVIASDTDANWTTVGDKLELTVAAAWYQRLWFRVLCGILGVAVIALLYRLRARQIATALGARFDERLAERTRLARELHDSLLQTIQGSKLVADDALEESGDLAAMRHALQRLSTWLARATQEGRAALNALRTSTMLSNDLVDGLKSASEGCIIYGAMDVVFSVDGEATDMHPIVRDEIYNIGYEAIRNACMHSKGSRLEVALTYARDLSLVVSDDGKGMDAATAVQGKSGHFGIRGMRERAQRIGADLTISSAERSGTEIRLVVPGRVIFRTPRSRAATLSNRLRELLGGRRSLPDANRFPR